MNLNKNNIKLEILNNNFYSEKYHTDPLFRRAIERFIHENANVQESELLQIISGLCTTIDFYKNKYESLKSTAPITKE